ncbi:uncharacterized transporter slc-17.2-like, partial [Argonauta hians]
MASNASCVKFLCSCRWRICVMCTAAFLVMQMLRVDLSMAFVCMLKTPNVTADDNDSNQTTVTNNNNQHCHSSSSSLIITNSSDNRHYEGEFEWSDTLQSNMLAGFFYGYMTTNILGGVLADKYGGRRVIGVSILSTSLLTLLYPSLTRISGYFTLVLRILTGIASGPLFPTVQSLFSRWVPPQEAGSLIGFIFSGQIVGNILGLSTAGFLCVYGFDNGWGSIFYIFGGISVLFSCVWFYVVYDSPDVHPSISEEEHSYLEANLTGKKVVKNVPWCKILTSPAVWAINLAWFAHSWTDLSFQILLPLYMKEALNVDTTSNGVLSSAPSLGQIISLPLCGKLADILRSKNVMSIRWLRVLFQTISLVISATFLITIGFLNCDQTALITFLLFAIGITISFSSGGVIVNNIDIAPAYAGVVFGIANTFATLSGGMSSLTTKALTPTGSQEEWRRVFAVFAAVCVAGAISYAVLARGTIQRWAARSTRYEITDGRGRGESIPLSLVAN